jgi:hypothetical protein
MDDLARVRRAKERISRGWCRGALARRRSHLSYVDFLPGTYPDDPSAEQWCLLGSLGHLEGWHKSLDAGLLERLFEKVTPPAIRSRYQGFRVSRISGWNDHPRRTSGEVLAILTEVEEDLLKEQSNG